jgi:glycosyltransferase involved in cell wall biosynthesis
LARDACRRGDDVEVLVPFRDPAADSAFVEACAPAPVRVRTDGGLRDLLGSRSWVVSALQPRRPQLVHTHLARALVLGATLARTDAAVRLTTHHHGDLFLVQRRRLASLAEAAALRRYDAVAAVSPAVAEHLVDAAHVDPARVRLVLNGWSGNALPHRPAAPPRIVCIGRLRSEKGHAHLLRAFAAVRGSRPDVSLDLLGDGPERASLVRVADELGLGESVVFHGDVPDVWPVLASATIAVQPSLVEQFGIGALEAMAAGVPIVASRTGGLGPLVEESAAGVLVPPGDAGALATAIISLLADPSARNLLGRAGPAYAAGLRLDQTLGAYAALYDELWERAGGR